MGQTECVVHVRPPRQLPSGQLTDRLELRCDVTAGSSQDLMGALNIQV